MNSFLKKRFVLLALFVLNSLFVASVSFASDLFPTEMFTVNGFGTIALTSSDSDVLGFRRDFYTESPVFKKSVEFRTDSLIGAQFTIQPTDKIKSVFQFIVRDFSEPDMDSLLQYAYVDFEFYPDISFRLGRNPLDIFLLSDYKDVGFAYPWARPVFGIYSTLFYHAYEGAEFRYVRGTDHGLFSVLAYVGICDELQISLEKYENISFDFDLLCGISLCYEHGPFSFLASYQRGTIENISHQFVQLSSLWNLFPTEVSSHSLISHIRDEVSLNSTTSDYVILGAVYDNGKWIIQSEASRFSFQKAFDLSYYSGYLSVGYRIKQFTPFVVFSKLYDSCNRIDIDGSMLSGLPPLQTKAFGMLQNILDDVDADQETLSVGLRWDLSTNCALKFQWNHNWIKKNQTTFWKRASYAPMDNDETVNVYSLSFDFFF